MEYFPFQMEIQYQPKNCIVPDCPWMMHEDTKMCHLHSLGLIPQEAQGGVVFSELTQTLEQAKQVCYYCVNDLPHPQGASETGKDLIKEGRIF